MSFSREVKRQLMHVSGITAIIPIVLYDVMKAAKILALAVLFFFFLDAYYTKRNLLGRTLKQIVRDFSLMERKEKKQISQNINSFQSFESKLIKRFFLPMSRDTEARIVLPSFLFFTSGLLTLILFGPKIAVIGIISLAVGDSVSAVFGTRFGNKKWSYNKNLSLEGSFAFFVFVSVTVFFFATYFPQYAIIAPWRLALIAGLVGAIVETIPLVNDNMSIPILVGLILHLIQIGVI